MNSLCSRDAEASSLAEHWTLVGHLHFGSCLLATVLCVKKVQFVFDLYPYIVMCCLITLEFRDVCDMDGGIIPHVKFLIVYFKVIGAWLYGRCSQISTCMMHLILSLHIYLLVGQFRYSL
jgi:hypothetical protein